MSVVATEPQPAGVPQTLAESEKTTTATATPTVTATETKESKCESVSKLAQPLVDHNGVPLSKNAIKKLRKRQEWYDHHQSDIYAYIYVESYNANQSINLFQAGNEGGET